MLYSLTHLFASSSSLVFYATSPASADKSSLSASFQRQLLPL
jgi:hypothetical protein